MNYNIKLNKFAIPKTGIFHMLSMVSAPIKNDIVLVKNRFGSCGQSIFNNINKS